MQNSLYFTATIQRPSGDQIKKNKTDGEFGRYDDRIERRGVYRALVDRPGVKGPYERPRRRWKDADKTGLQEIG